MNPVLRKDLIGLLRLKRVAAVQLFFVGVLAVLVMATWPQGGVVGGSVGIGDGLVRTDDRLLVGLIIGQIAMLILFVPGIAAVGITSEKEQNTLEMLYASRLRPREIIAGKIELAILYPLILLLSGLPFVALLTWRGDVLARDVLWAYSLLVLSALFLSMLSLTISSFSRQSATALVISYAVVLVLCGAVLIPAAIMLDSQTGYWPQRVLHYLRAPSPVAAALSRFRPELMGEKTAASTMVPLYLAFLPVAGAGLLACFVVVAARLVRPPSSSEGFGAVAAGGEERSLYRRLMYIIDSQQAPAPFGYGNPVIKKERRTSSLSSGRWMIRIFYGALFLSLGLAIMSLYGGTEYPDLLRYVATVLVCFQLGLIALVVPSLTSATISSEIENTTFETLRLSRLRGGQIFWGKFLPAILPAALPVVALLPAYGALAFVQQGYITYFVRVLPIVLLAVLFCVSMGLVCSAFFGQTARATVMAYLMSSALFIVPVFAWLLSGRVLSQELGARLGFLSPLVMALNLLPTPEGQPPDPTSDAMKNYYYPHLYCLLALCAGLIVLARLRVGRLLRQG